MSGFKSSQQRIAIILDEECPREVLDTIANHDYDDDVILSVALGKLFDNELLEIICSRLNKTKEEVDEFVIQTKKANHVKQLSGICTVPWNHVSTNAVGTIRMCCQMINLDKYEGKEAYGTVYKNDGEVLTVEDNISENRNSPAWKRLRKQMLAGEKPSICNLCYQEEDNGIGSRRDWTNDYFSDTLIKAVELTDNDGSIKNEDFPIEYWDLRFGNKCNLACRSCGPTDSDLWYNDWKTIKKTNTFVAPGHGTVTITDDNKTEGDVFEWYDNGNLLENIKKDIKNIKRFYFTGGEPTINHAHRKLLQFCIDNGHAERIDLDYNTNMAGVPSKIFTQWKEFKSVNLGMSIDGIFEHFEYIRYPGKWSSAYKNMVRIDSEDGFERVIAGVSLTLSIMNVLHVLDMQWWMLEQSWERIDPVITIHNLYGPPFYNIQNLTDEQKEYVKVRYEKFINDIKRRWPSAVEHTDRIEEKLKSVVHHMMEIPQNKEDYIKFLSESKILDNARSQDWRDVLPEIDEMIKLCTDKEQRKRNVKLATAGKR
jgi:organic radical activating enzyme